MNTLMRPFDFPGLHKIGVFDSGLGGLTVLAELLRQRPGRDYVYFGDTAHVPYGSRSADEVISLVSDIARHLVEKEGCQGLILACNTSSALAIDHLREIVSVPVLGVIETASSEAARTCSGRVTVLANPLTASSGVYGRSIRALTAKLGGPEPQVTELGCPELVSIVEEERLHTSEARRVLERYARRIEELGTDTLVLGCTHYPWLLPVLKPLLSSSVQIVNPAKLVPAMLSSKSSFLGAATTGRTVFQVSGDPNSFQRSAVKLLETSLAVEKVMLSSWNECSPTRS